MKMRILTSALMAAALLVPLSVQAASDDSMWGWMSNKSQREGFYAGVGGLAVMQQDSDSSVGGVSNNVSFDTGWGVVASGGYAWGNGFRTEGELAYRRNNVDAVSGPGAGAAGGHITNGSLMANVLYDFKTGSYITPYIGAGVGAAVVNASDIGTVNSRVLDSERLKFAYQAIGGVAFAVADDWAITTEYRYFRTTDADFRTNAGDEAKTENASHNVLIGVRYTFGEPEAAPAPVPMAQPVPAPRPMAQPVARPVVPAVPQSYMVFFDFDKATLTPEAKRILASAAQDYKSGQYVRIMVTGHTDTMGTAKYNKKLSQRRAAAVKQEFASLGVPDADVGVKGMGKSALLVPTNDQVREAQNRRAEIVFSK